MKKGYEMYFALSLSLQNNNIFAILRENIIHLISESFFVSMYKNICKHTKTTNEIVVVIR